MKKNLTLGLAALFLASNSLQAQVMNPSQSSPAVERPLLLEQKLGKEVISSLREAYKKGEYSAFLKEMQSAYQAARERNLLAGLSQFREGPSQEDWVAHSKNLQREKSQELLQAVGTPSSRFAEKVRSAAASLSTPEQEKAIERLAALRQMPLGMGKNSDENRLIELDLEYEFKAIHLDLPLTQVPDRREKHYILKMEKMDKMGEAARSFQDASLKQAVDLAAVNFDARLTQNWDLADLNALANGKQKPTSPLEEKVVSILHSYRDQLNELSKHYLEKHVSDYDEAKK